MRDDVDIVYKEWRYPYEYLLCNERWRRYSV